MHTTSTTTQARPAHRPAPEAPVARRVVAAGSRVRRADGTVRTTFDTTLPAAAPWARR